jgi:hypothetical protein
MPGITSKAGDAGPVSVRRRGAGRPHKLSSRQNPVAPIHLGHCGENELVFIDRFLSEDECSQILDELGCAFWQPSLTYRQQTEGSYVNMLTPMRVSETAHEEWFGGGLKALLKRIARGRIP